MFLWLSFGCEAQNQYLFQTPSVQIPYSTFNDLAGWWRADTFTGSSGSYSLTDKSGNGNHMIQQAGTLTSGTGVNSQAKFTGGSTAYLNSNLTIKSWPVTIITIAVRANNVMCGFFGHQGATGFNTLWYGYESSNQNTIYNSSGTVNTTSEAGSIACYEARIGWGSRVALVNGIIQSSLTGSPNIVQSSLINTTIGTQYRGLNCDWYETLVWNRNLSLSDLDEVHAYINARYGMSIPLWSSYTSAPVIAIWGQSNASGRGTKSYLTSPYNTSQTNVYIWNDPVSYANNIGTTWSNLDESAFNNDLGDGQGNIYFGYEASLGYNYINRVGGSVYLFKWSAGGTNLGKLDPFPFWDAIEPTTTLATGKRLFVNYLQNWWKSLVAFQTAGQRPDVIGIIGTQGEQDATDATLSANYQTNLINFYNTLRPEMGTDKNNAPVKIIITRLPNGQAGETYLNTVQTAQTNAASILTNAVLFNTDSYSFQGGNVHWSNASYIQIGIDLAGIL